MIKQVKWPQYFNFTEEDLINFRKLFGDQKVFAMGLMPVRGPKGFRKLDYEFAENSLGVEKVIKKLEETHFNVLGLVIKDTDGACVWDTKIGWNPTNRDILGEFCDASKDHNIKLMASFTSMNDAYQGHIHPERVSVHGRNGKKNGQTYKKGDISTHEEGEMRIDLPVGMEFNKYKEKIPFMTNKFDEKKGKARGSRGLGYIPTTSFMCPNSEHIDYLIDLSKEVVNNYNITGFFADYIRYDGGYPDLCTCERCITNFREIYGNAPKLIKSNEWYDFKENTITSYAEKLHDSIKKVTQNCASGWFCLPGPKNMFTRKRLGQNWQKLSSILDVASPMEYPYLMGTRDDGWYWGKLADFFYWYFIRNIKKRAHEFKSPVLTVTNSVECNTEEMLKQMRGFDFGLGIAVFKYFGTSDEQWMALKRYAEDELQLKNLE